jgi:chemotaxis protein CheX
MDADVVNEFITATSSVFEQVSKITLRKQKMECHTDGVKIHPEVAVIIGFTGAIRGQMVSCITRKIACQYASALLLGEPIPTFGETAISGVCEMANAIAGHAAAGLQRLGYVVDISLPSVVSGEQVEIGFQPTGPVLVLTFICDWGPVLLYIKFDQVSPPQKKEK